MRERTLATAKRAGVADGEADVRPGPPPRPAVRTGAYRGGSTEGRDRRRKVSDSRLGLGEIAVRARALVEHEQVVVGGSGGVGRAGGSEREHEGREDPSAAPRSHTAHLATG